MRSVVITKDLKKRFFSKQGLVEAVAGVDIEVFAGEVFGFLGPNGAGKTTTLRMLTTLLPIECGRAEVAGFDVQTSPNEVRRRIGYVSQKGGADEQATGMENLLLQGQLYGLSKEGARGRAEELVERFALQELIRRKAASYSGGQRRRLDLALGLIHGPSVLFLDEPTTGLDLQNRVNLWQYLLDLKAQGVTVFLTSHYLEEIDFLADRLAIIDHGKIITQGTVKELKQEIVGDVVTVGVHAEKIDLATAILSRLPFIREHKRDQEHLVLYVEKGAAALPELIRVLDREKIDAHTLTMTSPTLSDLFLKKTGRSLRDGGERGIS